MNKVETYKASLTEWIIFTLIFFFLYDAIWAIADFEDFKHNLQEYYLSLLMDFVYCGVFSFISLWVNPILLKHKFFRLAETSRSRFLRSLAVIVMVNIFLAVVFDLVMDVIDPDFIEDDVWGTFFLFGIIASLLTLIHLLLHYSNIIIRRNKENVSLQKKYLKLQLDPHFVFNSLSSLAGMIDVEPEKAEEYVVRLSQVYRYMLQHLDVDYITIDEAIDFAKRYVELLNLRYDNRVILDVDSAYEDRHDCILALSLQLLIENAVKHNAPNDNSPLHIQISVHDGMLRIKNNRIYESVSNDQSIDSYGIGLTNLNRRYELECGKKVEYTVTQNSFEILLPIIKKRIKTYEKDIDNRG